MPPQTLLQNNWARASGRCPGASGALQSALLALPLPGALSRGWASSGGLLYSWAPGNSSCRAHTMRLHLLAKF